SSDGFHGGKRKVELSARRRGAFAIKMHQVRQDRLRAELPQKRCDLPAMIASVIHDMLHRLPERIAVNAELQRLVFYRAVQIRLRQPAHKTEQPRLVFVPAFFKTRDVLKLCCIWKRFWRAALKPFQPDPFGAENVRERIAHGSKD